MPQGDERVSTRAPGMTSLREEPGVARFSWTASFNTSSEVEARKLMRRAEVALGLPALAVRYQRDPDDRTCVLATFQTEWADCQPDLRARNGAW